MKILEAGFNPETGESVFTFSNRLGVFSATSRLMPEDIDVVSTYAGCQFAEIKAKTKYVKKLWQNARFELETLEKLYRDIEDLKQFPLERHSQTCQFIRKQIKMKRAEVQEYKDAYEELRGSYLQTVDNRLEGARTLFKQLGRKNDWVHTTFHEEDGDKEVFFVAGDEGVDLDAQLDS